ncbi:MAG: asparagine synthase (glutamine-hydrolyzing) [Pseudoalteromonas sp.]|uniref:asparagine synthase (glutamine-hydrolyzing) n=1 Tax=Pseudoalteromonas sp. TaxID=53249 RepID=UPI000C8A03C7|nr:asparagine synthase (glutamine-hydrolyzing) [Pseudoalteromonas sp.]MAD02214.1 asparagine synthase (glutamine-hydrolyzing) [Pseudoalteromonas sp.]|tara:strand:+ start:69423 stop:71252 length:1830 start_codon:yes stop_codon:yes gene_type:complete
MCGITGFINLDGSTPDLQTLEKMNNTMVHRGPDGFGHYIDQGTALAHRRLSIIDLSEAGKQPMSNQDGSIWVTFNGEIYNYVELAKTLEAKGYHFNSHCDTEVIVHAYKEYGKDCLKHFNGMYGFALWDKQNQTLFAARDRIGIKPLYYYFDGQVLVFGSELKALLAHSAVPVEPERSTIMEYLAFSTNWGNRSWFKNIKQLEPGCSLTLKDGKLTVEQYWDLDFQPDHSRSFGSFVEELQELLSDSIHLHLRADVPVGAHLSGGIDSSSVVALASGEVGRLHTFSGAFSEGAAYDEREFIDIVANQFNTRHHVTLPQGIDMQRILPDLLWHLDEPVAGPGSFPQYHVCQLVQDNGVKVVLGGQGGDELFGGYMPYYAMAVKNMTQALKRGKKLPPISELMRLPQYAHRYGYFNKFFGKAPNAAKGALWRLSEQDNESIHHVRQLAFAKSAHLDPFEKQSYQHVRYYLPTLLHVEDRTSMACSIESRVPLLDYRLAELAAKMPSWMKVRQGTLKFMLRQAMRGKTPDAVLNRTDKKGFPTPIGTWFKGPLSHWVKEVLNPATMLATDYIDPKVQQKLLDEHFAGVNDHGAQIWAMLNLEMWMRGLSKHG